MIAGLVLLAGGAAVGLFGSLLGLGGGILLVPLLTLGFGLPLREAVAISLVSVIVTSSAGGRRLPPAPRREPPARDGPRAVHRVRRARRRPDRVRLPVPVLEGLFALLLAWVAVSMLRRREPAAGRGAGEAGQAPPPRSSPP